MPDFEDVIQYFTATENVQKLIFTRNKPDFKGSKIPVMTTREFLNPLYSDFEVVPPIPES